jgi:hypothetical protein
MRGRAQEPDGRPRSLLAITRLAANIGAFEKAVFGDPRLSRPTPNDEMGLVAEAARAIAIGPHRLAHCSLCEDVPRQREVVERELHCLRLDVCFQPRLSELCQLIGHGTARDRARDVERAGCCGNGCNGSQPPRSAFGSFIARNSYRAYRGLKAKAVRSDVIRASAAM